MGGNQYTKIRELSNSLQNIPTYLWDSVAKARVKSKKRSDVGKKHRKAEDVSADKLNRKIRKAADAVDILLMNLKDLQEMGETIPGLSKPVQVKALTPEEQCDIAIKNAEQFLMWDDSQEWELWEVKRAENLKRKEAGLELLPNPSPDDIHRMKDYVSPDAKVETDLETYDRLTYGIDLANETWEDRTKRMAAIDKACRAKLRTPEAIRRRMRVYSRAVYTSEWRKREEAKRRKQIESQIKAVERKKKETEQRAQKNLAARLALIPQDFVCPNCGKHKPKSKQWCVNEIEEFAICRSCVEKLRVATNKGNE